MTDEDSDSRYCTLTLSEKPYRTLGSLADGEIIMCTLTDNETRRTWSERRQVQHNQDGSTTLVCVTEH